MRTAPGEDEVEAMVARGGAIVGTPEDAIAAIERIINIAGGFLGLAHEWAPRQGALVEAGRTKAVARSASHR